MSSEVRFKMSADVKEGGRACMLKFMAKTLILKSKLFTIFSVPHSDLVVGLWV